MSDDEHFIGLTEDGEGWVWADCECGWREGPFPGRSEAIDAYGDHRAATP